MKKAVVILASFALFATLASAQTHQSKSQKQSATTAEGITVTGKIITTSEDGAATSYQPLKTLVIREDSSNKPGTYVLNGPGHVVDTMGALVQNAVRPGTRVRVFYTSSGDLRVIDRVVILD
jgi:hypothetical protein